MKKLLSILLIGVILIGIGAGVSVFEFAGYSYGAAPEDGVFANTTTNVYSTLPTTEGAIYFDNSYSYTPVHIATDELLGNEIRLSVTGPSQLLRYRIATSDNTLHFYYETDPFKSFSAILESAKHKRVFEFTPSLDITLYANAANAQRIVIGRDPALNQTRDEIQALQQEYQDNLESLQLEYQDNLADYQEQIVQLNKTLLDERETHDQELQDMRNQYEEILTQLREQLHEQS